MTMLEVSGVTIRQDLTSLQNQGFIQRVHGGAVLQSEDEISHRLSINYDVKTLIAEAAFQTIKDGETIFIEAGSANALLARLISVKSGVTVVTNNVFITRIFKNSEVNVILLGGLFQHQSECLVGSLACNSLEHLNFSRAFLGVDGISADSGITCSDMLRSEVSAQAIKQSRKVYVISDSAKIGKSAMSRVCALGSVDYLITDEGIDDAEVKMFEEEGLKVIIARH